MLILGRRVGESLKVGNYRLVLRTRHVGGAEITIMLRKFISIKNIQFGCPLPLGDEITVIPHPHSGKDMSDTMSQVNFHIQAPKHIHIQRDELEARKHNHYQS